MVAAELLPGAQKWGKEMDIGLILRIPENS